MYYFGTPYKTSWHSTFIVKAFDIVVLHGPSALKLYALSCVLSNFFSILLFVLHKAYNLFNKLWNELESNQTVWGKEWKHFG